MRPDPAAALVGRIADAVPELDERRRALAGAWAEDPCPFFLLEELAGIVARRLPDAWAHEAVLTRCFAAVEDLLRDGDPEVWQMVAYGFLDTLGPAALALVEPWMGEATSGLLECLESGGAGTGGWPDPDLGFSSADMMR